ncbi:hypothetical protein Ddye_019310 [Dipteronia dyeriana]|uniref:RNase H type-1 domain-containing protein n=1 Tax=Dipteronia dyeriana TaxID=168575 RepID=A0AAD9WVW7_9ROSI|nr:hypothetical protein Ddye_019310 [Dipteronia dyeriana]
MVVSSWSPPPLGVFKINTDATIDVAKMRTGIGIIARDSSGAVMASSAQMVRVNYELQIAEAIAILRGVQFALEAGSFVPRKTNMVAHCLTKEGLLSESDVFWFEEVPQCASPTVLGDCPNSL